MEPIASPVQAAPAISSSALAQGHTSGLVRALIVLTWAGFIARLVLCALSYGSNDWLTWRWFGALGLVTGPHAYEVESSLNHPPLPVIWSSLSLVLASFLGIHFPFVFRLPAILADLGSCLLLRKIWTARRTDGQMGWIASAAMAWNLDAILVGAFHCNTDNICVFLILLAAHQLMARRRPNRAGLALAGALNIKLIALLFLPLLLTWCWKQTRFRDAMRFLAAFLLGASIMLIPFLVVPTAYYQNVFRYNPQPAEWGVMYLLMNGMQVPGWEMKIWETAHFYVGHGRYVVLTAAALIALLAFNDRERRERYDLVAMVAAAFLFLTPGFGFQYTVYGAPLLLACNLRWGVVYGTVAGLYLLLAYGAGWDGHFPAQSVLMNQPNPLATYVALGAWLLLGTFTLVKGIGRVR